MRRTSIDGASLPASQADPSPSVQTGHTGAGSPHSASSAAPAAARMQLGGMALRDGVLFMGPRHWAAALRAPDGAIEVSSGRRPRVRGLASRVPLARGLVRLAESMAVLPIVRREMGPVLPQEDPRLLAAAGVGALAGTFLRSSRRGSPAVREALVAAATLAPALVALRDSRVAGYHGAEHNRVNAVESGGDAGAAGREHLRCGSMLIAPLLTASALTNTALRRAGADRNPAAVLGAGVLSIGAAMELFSWAARHEHHPLARLVRVPGLGLQRFATTREPTGEQLEVADAAMNELLRLEGASPSHSESSA